MEKGKKKKVFSPCMMDRSSLSLTTSVVLIHCSSATCSFQQVTNFEL